MDFDKWFNSQSTILKAILLIIPIVSWIVEILIRLSVLLRVKNNTESLGGGGGEVSASNFAMFLVVLCFGWSWIVCVIDLIYMLMNGHLILAENE